VAGDLAPISTRVRSIILLAGAVREGHAGQAIGGVLLDFPLKKGLTLLDAWRVHVAELAQAWGRSDLALRVLVNRTVSAGSSPSRNESSDGTVVHIEADRSELRGTGGVLRDLSDDYKESDLLLILNANQVLLTPLHLLVREMSEIDADVTILAAADGTPCGIQLVRVSALRTISPKGFVDFKEQALTQLALTHRVRVVTRNDPPAQQIRTLDGYIAALRRLSGPRAAPVEVPPAFAEDWSPSFGLVDTAATVDRTALVHDSVVLARAKVGAGAVLLRSVISEDAIVAPGELVIDKVVLKGQHRARVTTK
jgi:NDP-sugar pyrophosphorylase family protein